MRKKLTYHRLIRTVQDEVPSYVSFLLMLKLDFSDNTFFYIVSFFLRFNGILILCGNFQISAREVRENKSISEYLRYFTTNFLLSSSKITNKIYNIISLVILLLFCFRMFFYIIVINELKQKDNLIKIKLTKYQIFMDHIVFLFYPFILEFLSQIYIAYIFPDKYIFKRDSSSIFNIIIVILNTFLIIAYNINNYFYLLVINRPLSDRDAPVRYRYSRIKFWIIFFLQNVCIIQSLDFYFNTDKQLEIFTYCYFCVFALIFFCLFCTSVKKYNYNAFTNHFVSVMSGFCFFSILAEGTVRILGYEIKNVYTLFIFNICKILTSCYFEYINNLLSRNQLFNMAKEELFKINKGQITNEELYDIFLYIFEILKDIKYSKDDVASIKLLNTIYEHQNICLSNNCKCRLIQILPHGTQYLINFNENLIQRIGFLIESSFIQADFSSDYNLTLILCEHFCLFKENPIMAYSLLQTLIYFNLKNLTTKQLLILYETWQKYIEISLSLESHSQLIEKYALKHKIDQNKKEDMLSVNILKERNFRKTFSVYATIHDIQIMMCEYCDIILNIMKQKNLIEETVKIIKSEDSNEINIINFQYLNSENIDNLIQTLKNESKLNKKLFKEISNIKSTKLPIEFYYKCFLFCDTFWEGKIDDNILPIIFSFTNDHNLYSSFVNPNIFLLLRQRFIDINRQGFSSHYCIFKYCKGMTISYFSEPLAQELGYFQEDLVNKSIDILFPDDLIKPHRNLILRYLISEQNRIFEKLNNRMFNKKGMSIDSMMNGASLIGLRKYLLIIVNVELIENDNVLYFFYNQNLDLISISNNNYRNYKLDLNLISNCKMNLLNLFEIEEEVIKKTEKRFLQKLDDFKYALDIMGEEFFVKKLFKSENKNITRKFKLIDMIENRNIESTSNKEDFKLQRLKVQKTIENIYNNKHKNHIKGPILNFRTKKKNVVNNISKLLNENDYVDINEKYCVEASEFFIRFQNSNNSNVNLNGNNKVVEDNSFNIMVKFDILYDTLFISVKIKEEMTQKGNELNNQLLRKDSKFSYLTHNPDLKNTSHYSLNKTQQTSMKKPTTQMSYTESNLKVSNKLTNLRNKFNSSKTQCEKSIKEIIFTLVFIILILYIIILVYQLNFIRNLKIIFLAFFYNYIQRDKLVNLFSVIISGYFLFVNLADYSDIMNLAEYSQYILTNAQSYSSSFHNFYQNYVQYRFALGKDLSTLYESFNVSKISVNWEIENLSTNYMKEAENMVHISTMSSINDNHTDIYEDAKIFFLSRYKDKKNVMLKTDYISILFYLCSNYQDAYYVFFQNIQDEIQAGYNSYARSSKNIYLLIESLGLIMNIFLLVLVCYFLLQTNKVLFKNIANLFIDFTQDGYYNFKNIHDNILIMDKLAQLKFLFNNFSLKFIDKFHKSTKSHLTNLTENSIDRSLITEKIKNKAQKNESYSKNSNKKNDVSNNNSTINATNKSLLNTKTNIIDPNVNLISKLNKKLADEKINKNISSKNSLLSDSKSSFNNATKSNINNSIILNNNKKNESSEEILTAELIVDKLKINDIKYIKIILWLIIVILIILVIYFFIKIIVTTNFIESFKNLFEHYSIITCQYSMVLNYYNNLVLLLINKDLGKEYILAGMSKSMEEQNKKSDKIRSEYLKNYKSVYSLFAALNRKQNDTSITNFEDVLCKNDIYCRRVLNSKYNIVNNGVNVALKAIVQEIDNYFHDYLKVKDNIKSFENITFYFIDIKYRQIDMSLNFLLSLVEERTSDVFLAEVNQLNNSFNTKIIILNIAIISLSAFISLMLMLIVIKSILEVLAIIENSTTRINKSICLIKVRS